ncbi:MAG: NAD(P)-binding domain-containing protein [Pseudomonadales bacterium]|nr:NAD(P)-binding domain-containing protein [Pseudomonadales bacterium]
MSPEITTLSYYAIPILLVYAFYLKNIQQRESNNRAVFEEAIETGMTSPPSLHPVINQDVCIGCEACVHACPEFPAHTVLGLIDGKANLVGPTDCIGHGACKTACPVDAISLVFGTAERGVDIPNVSPEFETNVPGIFIAGELGGMGLIRNAVMQGQQALSYLAAQKRVLADGLDVAIIGAGPAGLAATLAAKEFGMKYVTIEQDSLGGTVANFPRGKLVMTAPVTLPLYGQMQFKETHKETLIDFWHGVEEQTGIDVNYREKLESVEREGDAFVLHTTRTTYRAASLLLALGRRGSPRTLDVPGEDLPKVAYSMIDPSHYADQHVCVVGGGDSALEAAIAIAKEPNTTVTLCYRSSAFSRAKRKNRDKTEALARTGQITVLMNSVVLNIGESTVDIHLRDEEQTKTMSNDAIIVCVGGILPTGFLKELGIKVDTKYGSH